MKKREYGRKGLRKSVRGEKVEIEKEVRAKERDRTKGGKEGKQKRNE